MNNYIETLELFARKLNQNNITWGLGGSFLLYYKNITKSVNDIDILVEESDYQKLLVLLEEFPYVYMESNEKYATKHFFSLTINKIDFDLMLDFKVNTDNGLYSFPFNKGLLEKVVTTNNVDIYLSSLDEWYNAYKAMNRDDKIKLLEEFYGKSNS